MDDFEFEELMRNLGYEAYIDKLREEGIANITHLKDVDDEIITEITETLKMNPEEIKGFESLCKSMRPEKPWDLKQLQQRKENLILEYKLYFKSLTPETKTIGPINTTEMTYFQLTELICNEERSVLKGDKTVELYSKEGYPLASSPGSLMCQLSRWNLEEYPEERPIIYAIPRLIAYSNSYLAQEERRKQGDSFVTLFNGECNLEQRLPLDLKKGNLRSLFEETQRITGIPGRLIKFKKGDIEIKLENEKETLKQHRILNKTNLEVVTQQNYLLTDLGYNAFAFDICRPTWYGKQSPHGINMFYSTLYCVAAWLSNKSNCKESERKRYMVLGYLRKLTCCSPLIHALYALFSEEDFTLPHRVAIQEVLFLLFKEIQPQATKDTQKISPVLDKRAIAEYSQLFWAHILSTANRAHMHTEYFNTNDLTCFIKRVRMKDPIECIDEEKNRKILDRDCTRNPNFNKKIEIREHGLLQRLTRSFSSISINAFIWQLSHHNIELERLDLTFDWPNNSNLDNNTLEKFPFLCIQMPLHVKALSCPKPCLIILFDGNVGVYVDQSKSADTIKCIAFSVSDGREVRFDPDELDGVVKQFPAEALSGYRGVKMNELTKKGLEAITRDPVELIFVLLDISGSMHTPIRKSFYRFLLDPWDFNICEDLKTKYYLAKEAFWAFSGRTQAYNFHHMIGLIGFGVDSKLIFPMSESFIEFEKEFEKDLPGSSSTSLYDAIGFAVEQFHIFDEKHPEHKNVPRRIICITDGYDNNSKLTPIEATLMVIENKIIVDNVILFDQDVPIHGIAKASGGYSFKFDSPDSQKVLIGLKTLFEEEPMLTQNCRANRKALCETDQVEEMMREFQKMDYDTKIEHFMPVFLNGQFESAEMYLSKAIIRNRDSKLYSICVKRILQELGMYLKNPHPAFRVFPSEETMQFWQILLTGPGQTSYQDGVFKLFIEFSDDYPKKPPKINFITPIYHCNVNRVGRICHASLDRKYKPSLTVRQIFDHIYGLLMKADPEDPLDSVLADEMRFNKVTYDRKAKEMTEQFASKPINQVVIEIIGEEIEYPTYLVCPITKTIFEDPVVAHGITYERAAIEEHLINGNNLHPYTLGPLEMSDLAPNLQTIEILKQFKKNLK